jgi:hypothetical protein
MSSKSSFFAQAPAPGNPPTGTTIVPGGGTPSSFFSFSGVSPQDQVSIEEALARAEAAAAAAEASETAAAASDTSAQAWALEAEHWAIYPEDSQVPEGDPGEYSAYHWAQKAMAAGGAVASVFGRVGAVVALTGDYSAFYAPIAHVGSTGVAEHGLATAAIDGFMSQAYASKLDGIAAGADVSPVTSVDARTGVVTLGDLYAALGHTHSVFSAGSDGFVPDPVTATGLFLKDDGTWAAPAGGGGAVDSVFGRTGAVVALVGDYSAFYAPIAHVGTGGVAEHPVFTTGAAGFVPDPGTPSNLFLRDDATWQSVGGAAPVDSVFTRTGAVVALAGDYSAFYAPIAHVGSNGVAEHAVATGALAGFMPAADFTKLAGIETGAQVNDVDTVFGRTGAVVALVGDYSAHYAPLAHVGTGGVAEHPNFTLTVAGFVPPPTTATGLFLKDDGTWAAPAGGGAVDSVFARTGDVVALVGDYSAFYAPLAHVAAGGVSEHPVFTATVEGFVPAPTTATGKYLKDNATWDTPAGGGGGSGTVKMEIVNDISAGFNGVTTSFDLTYATSTPIDAETVQEVMIWIDGVAQEPGVDYTRTDADTFVFTTAPEAGQSFMAIWFEYQAVGDWHTGAGVPSAGLGADGDMYLDTSTQDIYGPKSGGAWGAIVSNIAGLGLPAGGTTGQVLQKASATDYDTTWGDWANREIVLPCFIETPVTSRVIPILPKANFDFTIETCWFQVASGTTTVTVKKNGTAITDLTSIVVTSTGALVDVDPDEAVDTGDRRIEIEIVAAGTGVDLEVALQCRRPI